MNLNLYFYTLNKLLLRVFLSITIINIIINKYFKGVLGGMGNNSNTVIIYLSLHAGIMSRGELHASKWCRRTKDDRLKKEREGKRRKEKEGSN